jgi:hypothetical protein
VVLSKSWETSAWSSDSCSRGFDVEASPSCSWVVSSGSSSESENSTF